MTVLMGLQARLRLARLYLCTDARTERGDLAEFCEAVFAGGVDILQIRQKEMDADEELEALQVARRAAERHQAIVCVNDSPELAERFSADMLHLGQTDGSSRRARRHLHRWALIGRSTHAPEQTDEAIADSDADYFCVGPVYATSTKPDYEPVGLDLVRYAARGRPAERSGRQALVRHRRHRSGQPRRRAGRGCSARLRGAGPHPGRRPGGRRARAELAAPAGLAGRSGDGAVHPGRRRLHRSGALRRRAAA